MAESNLTAARLRELLNYDPSTGLFTWRVSRQGSGAKPGKLAGAKGKNGYVYIGVDQRRMLAHRLAVLYVTGSLPAGLVDHIDGVKVNNRWANLRSADKSINGQNMRKPHSGNSSGLLGVSRSKVNDANPWLAQIKPPGCGTKNLGYFSTPEEAHEAYLAAKRLLHDGNTL